MKYIHIDYIAQEQYVFDVCQYLQRKGALLDDARRIAEPLDWYMRTGRASADWLRACMVKRPYLVARILDRMQNASYETIIAEITRYIAA